MYFPKIDITVSITTRKNARDHFITSTSDAVRVCRKLFDPGKILWVEEFVMICLDNQNKLLGYYRVSQGGRASAIVDVRVIATIALNCMASSVIIAHNHPSGSLKPSLSDKKVTTQLVDALLLLDIRVIDHIIITQKDFYSFHSNGLIN